MSPVPAYRHHRAMDLEDALGVVSDDVLPYSGGTELLAVMRIGLINPEGLVDLKRVSELRGIHLADGNIVIGGGSTHRQVALDPLVIEHAPILAEVADRVGNVRVRSSGTFAGNLVFAEPRSDLSAMLLALDASVVLRSRTGVRTVHIDDFIVAGYVSDLQPGELLVSVLVPTGRTVAAAYRKFQTAERPTVGVAIVVTGDACRVAVGAAVERPSLTIVATLDDVDPATIASSLEISEDLAGAEDYKRHVTAVTIRRTIEDIRRRLA